jgi:hypothetical protein
MCLITLFLGVYISFHLWWSETRRCYVIWKRVHRWWSCYMPTGWCGGTIRLTYATRLYARIQIIWFRLQTSQSCTPPPTPPPRANTHTEYFLIPLACFQQLASWARERWGISCSDIPDCHSRILVFESGDWGERCHVNFMPGVDQTTYVQHIYYLSIIVVAFFFFWCTHLEQRGSVKLFVSLQFLNLRQSVGLLWLAISPSQGRYLTKTLNKRTGTSIPWVGFGPKIPVFELAKTFHALDRASNAIGLLLHTVKLSLCLTN